MSHFFAYISRLKLIKRWSLMRNTSRENSQEHSWQVAVIAHALATIQNQLLTAKSIQKEQQCWGFIMMSVKPLPAIYRHPLNMPMRKLKPPIISWKQKPANN